jgi:hypothetical protein
MRMYGFNDCKSDGENPGCLKLGVGWLGLELDGWPACWVRLGRSANRAQTPAQAVEPVQVQPGVWMVQGVSALGSPANRNFISNAAFVVTPDGVVVIDALGSPALARELVAAIAASRRCPCGTSWSPTTTPTTSTACRSSRPLGATITAHAAARPTCTATPPAAPAGQPRGTGPWIDERTQLVPADRWVADTTRFTLGGVDFVLQPCRPGAHARGPGGGAAAAGRADRRRPGLPRPRALCRPGRQRPLDRPRWTACWPTTPRTIVPGHGPASTSAVADLPSSRATTCSTCARPWAKPRATWSPSKRPMPRPTGRASTPAAVQGGQPHQRLQHLPADGAERQMKRRHAAVSRPGRRLALPAAARLQAAPGPARPGRGLARGDAAGRQPLRPGAGRRAGGGGGVLVHHLPLLPAPQPACRKAAPRRCRAGPEGAGRGARARRRAGAPLCRSSRATASHHAGPRAAGRRAEPAATSSR